ncbi:DUF2243 domain-containing protein [Ornithinibacillus massiliensis]|uniref:DUF2243 domain-containing protein n=2 Tax=Ornithinibacillus massiliensis TaxID=1944633 RepID=A0ABS5MGV3_9BACI|nr:DUF2243 domain-containing protein [Ornithinibacillus massiliensis]
MRTTNKTAYVKRNILSGVLFGLGLVAFLDEVIFHQILHWHKFYDRSTTNIGLISDGFFHAFSWLATVSGLFLVADLRRRDAFSYLLWQGSVLLGAGTFNLYDGIIQHKIMRIHQIRYVDNVIIYDVIWNLLAVALMIIGLSLILQSKKKMKETI